MRRKQEKKEENIEKERDEESKENQIRSRKKKERDIRVFQLVY